MALFSRLQGAVFGLGIGAAAKDAVDPVLETAKQTSWGQRAVRVLAPTTAAEAEARGLGTTQTFTSLKPDGTVEQFSDQGASRVAFADDAKRQGFGAARYEIQRRLAQTMPTVQQALELWNRGRVTETTVDSVLARLGYPTGVRPALKALAEVLPPVQDLVRFAVREVYNPDQRKDLDLDQEFPAAILPDSRRLGLSDASTRNYWAAHWELPSYEQLATMRFRNLLTPKAFSDALKAADYAPTWRAKLEEIARAIPTMTDMIRFAVREVYDPAKRAALGLDAEYPDEFTAQAALHGMTAEHAKQYWAAHWRLPSAEQGYRMLHRGIIQLPELDTLLKALDYPTLWRDRLRDIAYLVPGRIDLRRMYAENIIEYPELLKGYKDLGYNDHHAKILADFAVKLAEKPAGTTRQSYVEKARGQLWTQTHTGFLAGDVSDEQVLLNLAQVGVPENERRGVLELWVYEREVVRGRMSPAQWRTAWRKGVPNPATGLPTTKEDVLGELLSRGWSTQDAQMFLDTPSTNA